MAENEEELKNLLMTVKEESEKAGLKLNIQKTKIMASDQALLMGPLPAGGNMGHISSLKSHHQRLFSQDLWSDHRSALTLRVFQGPAWLKSREFASKSSSWWCWCCCSWLGRGWFQFKVQQTIGFKSEVPPDPKRTLLKPHDSGSQPHPESSGWC